MSFPARPWHWCFWIVAAFCAGPMASAREPTQDPRGPLNRPRPVGHADTDHWRAVQLYARGLLDHCRGRPTDAVKALEEAARLDPRAAAPRRALVGLYLALGRLDDGLKMCEQTLALNPRDGDLWYLYASQLREKGRARESAQALTRGLARAALADRRDLKAQMCLELAGLCEDSGDWQGAVRAYRGLVPVLLAVLDHPADLPEFGPVTREASEARAAEAYERLVRACTQAGRYDEAVAAFHEARARGLARSGRLSYQLARAYAARSELGLALKHVEEYLATQPASTEGYELRADLLTRLGRREEILPGLERSARQDAHNVALHLLLAQKYAAAGRTKDAEKLYRRLADESPGPDVYRGLFALYRAARGAQALTLLNEAIAAGAVKDGVPGDPAAASRVRAMVAALREDAESARALTAAGLSARDLHPNTLGLLGALAARNREPRAAEQLYRACLTRGLPPRTEAELYPEVLRALWDAHRRSEVIALCRKALGNPFADRLLLQRNLAMALALNGNADEALAASDAALRLAGPDQRLALALTRVDVLRALGRWKQAEDECKALLHEAPPSGIREIRYALSGVYSAAHDTPRAEEQLRLILKGNPDDAAANNDLGYLMADEGRALDEAEMLIRKALAVDRRQRTAEATASAGEVADHAAYVDSLGWVLFRRGRLEEARVQLEKAVSLSEGACDPVVWDHLGDVYARLGRDRDARSAWQKALGLYESDSLRRPDEQYRRVRHKLGLGDASVSL